MDRVQPHGARAHQPDLRAAVQAGDPRRIRAQQLRREVPQRADDLRADELDLPEQVLLAVLDLHRRGIAVAGRAALEDVGDEDVVALQADAGQQLLEHLPRCADEGQAALVLARAGRLPHEHEVRVGVAGAEDDLRAGRGELRAAGAAPRLREDLLELLATRLGGHHRRDGRQAGRRCVHPARAGRERGILTGGHHPPRGWTRRTRPEVVQDRDRHPTKGGWTEMSIDTDVGCPAGCTILGAGRVGTALAAALHVAGIAVEGPLGRGEVPTTDAPVLLCVPDAQIAVAAATLQPGRLVGHTSGATTLDVLTDAGHEAFSLHPLMTIPLGAGAAQLAGAPAAVAGSTPRALRTARALAQAARLDPIDVADADRAAYHAAASIAANLLVTLQDGAERLLATAGADRAALVPLVRAAVEAWAREGGQRALTGPIARGDHETVARQRAAIADRTPDLLEVFDALAAATARLAARDRAVAA